LVETYPLTATAAGLLPTRHQIAELQDFEPAAVDQLNLLAFTNGLRYGRFTDPSGISVLGPSIAPRTIARPTEVTGRDEGTGGGGITFGSSGGSITSFECKDYRERDNCMTCCNDKQSAAMAILTGAGVGVAAVGATIPVIGWVAGVIVGGVIVAAGVVWPIIEGDACRERCKNMEYGSGLNQYPNL
jgi:hypothetical protein